MDTISEWRRDTFDLLAFENVPVILKRIPWKREGGAWKSNHHLNGERDSKGAFVTFIRREQPWNVHTFGTKGSEYTNESGNVEIIKLKAMWEGKEYRDALKAAAAECGLSVPSSLTDDQLREYDKIRSGREAARSEMAKALWADTAEAKAVLDYLHGRKWKDEEIAAAGFGLCTKGIAEAHKDTGIFLKKDSTENNPAFWTSHNLAIPYWAGERIAGFTFRRTDGKDDKAKYLNSEITERGGAFFNVGYGKELVIVEGYLDALKAKAMGATNVVAAGGRPSAEQVADAVKRGARVITLVFDKDAAGDTFIKPTIDMIRNLHDREIRVYVGDLPESQDLDEYLTERGLEEFKDDVLKYAKPAAVWIHQRALMRADDLMKKNGEITFKERDEILDEIVANFSNPHTSPQDAGEIEGDLNTLENAIAVDLGKFKELLEDRRAEAQKVAKNEDIRRNLARVEELFAKGDAAGAIAEIKRTAAVAGERGRDDEFAVDFRAKSRREVIKKIGETRDGIPTGYKFVEMKGFKQVKEEKLTLNAGITFVCASRGHGKTSMLNSMVLNEARRIKKLGTGQSVLYFSYEIPENRLMPDLLKAFVGDKYISRQDDTIRFFCRHYDEEQRGQFVSKKTLPPDFVLPEDYFGRETMPEELSHWEYFDKMQDIFFGDYIDGDIIKVLDKSYKLEELLAGIKWQLSHTRKPVSVVFIDYAQLIFSEEYTSRREEEIKSIVHSIKDFANTTDIPFVMAAQFNRQVSSPATVDTCNIGEGGDFERIADTVIGLYNLKELKKTDDAGLTKELLVKAGLPDFNTKSKIEPIDGKIFAALLKRRYGAAPLYSILDFEWYTKRVEQNDKGAALRIPDSEFGGLIDEEGEPSNF